MCFNVPASVCLVTCAGLPCVRRALLHIAKVAHRPPKESACESTPAIAPCQWPIGGAQPRYNGCQGSTLVRAVLDIRRPPFCHGHLYVALSRVRRREHMRIMVSPEMKASQGEPLVRNIVWPELLLPDEPAGARQAMRKRPAAAPVPTRKPQRRRR